MLQDVNQAHTAPGLLGFVWLIVQCVATGKRHRAVARENVSVRHEGRLI